MSRIMAFRRFRPIVALLCALVLGMAGTAAAESEPSWTWSSPAAVGDDHVALPPVAAAAIGAGLGVAPVGDVDGHGREYTATLISSLDPWVSPSVWVSFASTSLPSTAVAGGPGWRGFPI